MTFPAVEAVATHNVVLSGLPTVDHQALTSGQNVLCVAQLNKVQNGLWTVASGAWARPSGYVTGTTYQPGTTTAVTAGHEYAGTTWALTSPAGVDVDTNPSYWQVLRPAGGSSSTIPQTSGPQTAPTVPSSGVPLSNPFGRNAFVQITAVAAVTVEIDSTSIGGVGAAATGGWIPVPAGHSITMTWSGTGPTWVWIAI